MISDQLKKTFNSYSQDPTKEKFAIFEAEAKKEVGEKNYNLCIEFFLSFGDASLTDALNSNY